MIVDAPVPKSAGQLFDRRLFTVAAIGFTVLVLVGFAPTYYLRGLFDLPPLSSLAHLHGLLMTAWVVLFLLQIAFISDRRVRLHRRVGYGGIALAALIAATGALATLRAGKYGSAAFPSDIPSLAFMIVPVFDLSIFVVLFGAAIYYRRQTAVHKRLMLLTALNFLSAAVARIPVAALQALGPLWFFGLPGGLALLCLGLDARAHGRVNHAFLAGSILLIASYPARLALMNTTGWMNAARWMTDFV